MGRIQLVLGGIRSGKSRFAEDLAVSWQGATGGIVTYVATARVGDAEMQARVDSHRKRRPSSWRLLEAPLEVFAAIDADVPRGSLVLLDCVNMLISNVLMDMDDEPRGDAGKAALAQVDGLVSLLLERDAPSVLISNEVGMAPVALTALGRLFQDTIGIANQRVAAAAEDVFLLVAGLAQKLK